MYDVSHGTIEIDNKDIRDIDLSSLRQQVSYVPQDVFLFSESVGNNIRFGRTKATQEQVAVAARQAYVDEEIDRLPQKYETQIGERGVMLSGGQKQRISIARALLKEDSQLVIFDDCLSAVDARTEKIISSNLNDFLKEKTAIVITHRMFSLLDFDRILVLQDGRIIEQGPHEDLMKIEGGYYRGMVEKQNSSQ
jgi:ATP-binding cassette subfamily B protein